MTEEVRMARRGRKYTGKGRKTHNSEERESKEDEMWTEAEQLY